MFSSRQLNMLLLMSCTILTVPILVYGQSQNQVEFRFDLELQRLLDENQLDEAEEILDLLEGDKTTLLTFRGILAFKRMQYKKALGYFIQAKKLSPERADIWLYLGIVYEKMGKIEEAKQVLGVIERGYRKSPAFFRLKARIEQLQGMKERAYDTLDKAIGLFPDDSRLHKDRIFILIDLGLVRVAIENAYEYIDAINKEDLRDAYLFVSDILHEQGETIKALGFLELACLEFKDDSEILARLGRSYAMINRKAIAADFYKRAQIKNNYYSYHAAECYRMAGKYRDALAMNSMVLDKKLRLSQRLALYIEQKRFARAIALTKSLRNAGALDDENKRLLIYAYLNLGEFEDGKALYSTIEDIKIKNELIRQISLYPKR